MAQAFSKTVTTAADGTVTSYIGPVRGRIHNIIYTKDTYDNTVDFTITTETTLQNVWVESNVTATKTVAPRQATHDTVGVASLYAAAGEPVEDYIWACSERIKIVLAQGGATKSGTFTVIVDE